MDDGWWMGNVYVVFVLSGGFGGLFTGEWGVGGDEVLFLSLTCGAVTGWDGILMGAGR